jgi:hypothetical protein
MMNILCLCIGLDAAPAVGYVTLLRDRGSSVRCVHMQTASSGMRSGHLSVDLLIVQRSDLIPETDRQLWQIKRAAPERPLSLLAEVLSDEAYIRTQARGVHEDISWPAADLRGAAGETLAVRSAQRS